MTSQDVRQLHANIPEVYDRLRELARLYMAREDVDHTLQATALVHEAYLRLLGHPPQHTLGPNDMVGFAARLMRQVLVNYAKRKGTLKRGRGWAKVHFESELACIESRSIDLLGLDAALEELRELDYRLFLAVELRFFGGLSAKDTAKFLNLSESGFRHEWATARRWLFHRLRNHR